MAEENNFFTTSFVSLAQVSFEDADIAVAAAVHPGELFGNDAKLIEAIKETETRKHLYKTGIVSAAEYSMAIVRQRLMENDRLRVQFPHADQPPWAAQMELTMTQMGQNMNDQFAQMEVNTNNRIAQMEVNTNNRFAQMENRFAQMEVNMNNRFAQMEGCLEGQFGEMDQRMASAIACNTTNMKRRTKNVIFFNETTEEPLRGIVKEISGFGPGLPNHPVQADPNLAAVGQIPPGFPATRTAFDRLTHAQLSMLSAQYNHTFGIVATDNIGSRRDKFKVFITDNYYLE